MAEVFRKSFLLGSHFLGVPLGAAVDIYQDTSQSGPGGGPFLFGQGSVAAGPVKLPINDLFKPVQNGLARTFSLANVPVPAFGNVAVDLALEIDDYTWTANPASGPSDGTATFKVVAIAVFHVLFKPTVHVGAVDVVITLSSATDSLTSTMTAAQQHDSVVQFAQSQLAAVQAAPGLHPKTAALLKFSP
jgi:hypothetical protein